MYTMAATAMSTVSMSIVGAYMTMLEPKYVVAALVLNMFSTFIVLSLINPYRVDASEENIQMSNLHEGQSFFEMLGEYILAGFKVAIIVAAMLIGFIALIAALNALFATVTGSVSYTHLRHVDAEVSDQWPCPDSGFREPLHCAQPDCSG